MAGEPGPRALVSKILLPDLAGVLWWGPLFFAASLGLCVLISNHTGQQPAWPPSTLSRYGAHWPAIIFFKVGTFGTCLVLVRLAGELLWPSGCSSAWVAVTRLGAAAALGVAAVGLGGVGYVNILEYWSVHIHYFFLVFVGLSAFMAIAVLSAFLPARCSFFRPDKRAAVRPYLLASLLLVVALVLILLADVRAYRRGDFGDGDLAFAKAYQIWACVEIVYAVNIVVFFMLLSGALLSFNGSDDYRQRGGHDNDTDDEEDDDYRSNADESNGGEALLG